MAKGSVPGASASKKDKQHRPLADDILATATLKQKSAKRKSLHEEEDTFVDAKASRKILRIGADLAEEEREENDAPPPPSTAFEYESRPEDLENDDGQAQDDEEAWGDDNAEEVEELEVDPNDLDLFQKFIPSGADELLQPSKNAVNSGNESRNLADIILQKIQEHEMGQEKRDVVLGQGDPEDAIEIPAKVVEVYTKIGLILSRYKSGKLPKPFKIIPTISYWEDLLAMTNPDEWTANACYEATKIFISGNQLQSQRFLETVILARVREDIRETKKLNVHLYKALKKALFKPAAFFKGFLFPLVSGGAATLREAHIVASILIRVSIPVLHSAAALMRLCEIAAEQASVSTEGGGATNILIRTLLEKKYALPYKVIDALVFHFLRFRGSDPMNAQATQAESGMLGVTGQDARDAKAAKLPVLWHQCLLAFAQRYRNDITEDQREALLDLLLIRGHSEIGPEVRRELLEGRGRGVPVAESAMDHGGDDTMMVDTVA